MATFTGGRAGDNFPAGTAGYGTAMSLVWGHIAIAANPADGDIYELCRTPSSGSGFLLLGGHIVTSDLDTGTEELDADLGWAANGAASAATWRSPWGTVYTDAGATADPDGLVNAGVLTGDAIAGLTAGGNYRPIILPVPLWFAKPTMIQLEANAAAATFAAGNVTVCLYGQII